MKGNNSILWQMAAATLAPEAETITPTPEWEGILQELGFEARGDEQLRETMYHLLVITHYAPGQLRLLLNGPTGSGKEIIAHAAHYFRSGKSGRFVTVNCATLNEGTATSELFGSKKGSYTGSNENKVGYFQLAQHKNDTIFLDEIHKLHPIVRPQLYRVLNEGTFHSLGDPDNELKFEGGVIAAASSGIDAMRNDGSFPQDLFSRLAQTGEVRISAFDERNDDHRRSLIEFGFQNWTMCKPTLETDVLDAMLELKYPGGIRDLRSIIGQLSSYAQLHNSGKNPPVVRKMHFHQVLKHWPISLSENHPTASNGLASDSFEPPESDCLKDYELAAFKCLLKKLAQIHGSNQTRIAKSMGITRGSLRNKILELTQSEQSPMGPVKYIVGL